jgi:hypothetical protein
MLRVPLVRLYQKLYSAELRGLCCENFRVGYSATQITSIIRLRRADCDWIRSLGNLGLRGRFGYLVPFALGFDVAELPVAAFYGQGYFHAHILGNCSGEGVFQRCQQCGAVFFLAPVHWSCPVQGVAGGHHPQCQVVVRDPQLYRALEQAHDHRVQ